MTEATETDDTIQTRYLEAESLPSHQRPPAPYPEQEPADEALDADLAAHATKRANTQVYLRTLARTIVSLAMEAGGQDPRYWRPADTLTAENFERMLQAVCDAPPVELPAAFRQSSAPADVAQANAVARAISG